MNIAKIPLHDSKTHPHQCFCDEHVLIKIGYVPHVTPRKRTLVVRHAMRARNPY